MKRLDKINFVKVEFDEFNNKFTALNIFPRRSLVLLFSFFHVQNEKRVSERKIKAGNCIEFLQFHFLWHTINQSKATKKKTK